MIKILMIILFSFPVFANAGTNSSQLYKSENQPFKVELVASIPPPHQSEYVYYPSVTTSNSLKQNPWFYKVLVSDTNMVVDCGGHYYNVITLESAEPKEDFESRLLKSSSSPTSEYVHFPNLTCFVNLNERPNYKVFMSEKGMVIDCDGRKWNAIQLEHPYGCPACFKFLQEYRH